MLSMARCTAVWTVAALCWLGALPAHAFRLLDHERTLFAEASATSASGHDEQLALGSAADREAFDDDVQAGADAPGVSGTSSADQRSGLAPTVSASGGATARGTASGFASRGEFAAESAFSLRFEVEQNSRYALFGVLETAVGPAAAGAPGDGLASIQLFEERVGSDLLLFERRAEAGATIPLDAHGSLGPGRSYRLVLLALAVALPGDGEAPSASGRYDVTMRIAVEPVGIGFWMLAFCGALGRMTTRWNRP